MQTKRATLTLVDTPGTAPRGPMMDAREVATALFHGKVTARWVRDTVPGKMTFGHSTVLWYRDDVLSWIDQSREGVA